MSDTFAKFRRAREASDAMNPDKAIKELNECIANVSASIDHKEAMIKLHRSELDRYPPLAKALTLDRIESLVQEINIDKDCIADFKQSIEKLKKE